MEHLEERVVDGAEKLLAQCAVEVSEGIKGECCHVVGVLDGRCFGDGRAGWDDGRCTGIEGGTTLVFKRVA